MLPVLYHLLKQLFGRTRLCTAGTLLFAFDFMHFTQTRIATIDTYAVFFLLLMYDAMLVFLRRDLLRDSWKSCCRPCWPAGVYRPGHCRQVDGGLWGLGLAALFFGKLLFTYWDARRRGEETVPLLMKCGKLCAWCCLFFLALPFGIYFGAFLPITTLSHNAGNLWGAFWNYQVTMFDTTPRWRPPTASPPPGTSGRWISGPSGISRETPKRDTAPFPPLETPCCGGRASQPWGRLPVSGGRSASAGRGWCWRDSSRCTCPGYWCQG